MIGADDTPACWGWLVPDLTKHAGLAANSQERIWLSWEWQHGRCAICGRGRWNDDSPMYDDHDHETGLYRGGLCPSCNTREGRSNDVTFVRYRQRNPATIWGIRFQYDYPRAHVSTEYRDQQEERDRMSIDAALDT